MERLTTRNSEGIAVLKIPYQCDRCGGEIYRLADCGNGEPIEELCRLEELKEQGRLLELPCAVGDAVYEINRMRNIVSEFKIKGFSISKWGIFVKWVLCNGIYNNLYGFNDSEIGKTVFLTREEAEEALERRQQG